MFFAFVGSLNSSDAEAWSPEVTTQQFKQMTKNHDKMPYLSHKELEEFKSKLDKELKKVIDTPISKLRKIKRVVEAVNHLREIVKT